MTSVISAPAPGPGRLLTTREAADLLNVSERTLFTLRTSGQIRHVRLGRLVRFDPADLLEDIERLKNGERQDAPMATTPSGKTDADNEFR